MSYNGGLSIYVVSLRWNLRFESIKLLVQSIMNCSKHASVIRSISYIKVIFLALPYNYVIAYKQWTTININLIVLRKNCLKISSFDISCV